MNRENNIYINEVGQTLNATNLFSRRQKDNMKNVRIESLKNFLGYCIVKLIIDK